MPDVLQRLREETPCQEVGLTGIRVKRDDLFTVAGVRGGKVRTCLALARGAAGLVTASSRHSPQVEIVAAIAHRLGIPARIHVPAGATTPEIESAEALGAEIQRWPAGYNTVIVARARADASRIPGWKLIPFGMECQEAVDATRAQVANLPRDIQRVVIPVGSGMSLAGVLWGLDEFGPDVPVLGVVVGADPSKRLDRWGPLMWERRVTLRPSGYEYGEHAGTTILGDLELDPVYEAKCLPFLAPGDLLWVVGIRGRGAP